MEPIMRKKILTIMLLSGITTQIIANNDLYLGVQSSSPSTGFSIKSDISNKATIQGIVDFMGEEKNYSFRGIFKFKQKPFYNIYGFGEIGVWSWDRRYTRNNLDETVIGYGVGVGVDYDLRGLDIDFIPLFINFELNYYQIDFENEHYNYYDDDLGLGLGLHYKF
jgi:hypothetical protein